MLIRLKTAPAAEPVELPEVKAHLRVLHDTEDALIAGFATAARQHLESLTGRAFCNQTWLQMFDGFPRNGRLRLGRMPLGSVVSITYFDGVDGSEKTLSSSDYTLEATQTTAEIVRARGISWPATVRDDSAAVTVEFVAGYGANGAAVPQAIKHAILLLTQHLYMNRSETSEKQIIKNPVAVDALIGPYLTHGWI